MKKLLALLASLLLVSAFMVGCSGDTEEGTGEGTETSTSVDNGGSEEVVADDTEDVVTDDTTVGDEVGDEMTGEGEDMAVDGADDMGAEGEGH